MNQRKEKEEEIEKRRKKKEEPLGYGSLATPIPSTDVLRFNTLEEHFSLASR